jgi:hypothetical protein
LAQDLVFRYADSFGDKFVSDEIKQMRARHYEELRVMKLKIVKDEFLKVCDTDCSISSLFHLFCRYAMNRMVLLAMAPVALSILTRALLWSASNAPSTPCGRVAKQSLIKWYDESHLHS